MNLGFDIDGVISDFVKTFSILVKKNYLVEMKEEQVHCFDLGLVLGIDKEERNKMIRATLQENLVLNEGASVSLKKLHLAGHSINLLTARSLETNKVTVEWLKKNRISYSELIHLDEGKKHDCKVNLDLIVEDNLENAIAWSGKVRNIFVYDHPWNQSLNVKGLFKRVKNWNEIMKEIEKLQ